MKADRNFFCKLAFIAKTRDLDLHNVYAHELGPIPWAIATPLGTPLKTDKSKLLEDIECGIPSSPRPQNAAWIIDAYSFIQTLKPLHKETGCTLLTVVKPSNFSEIALSIMSSLCNISCPQPDRIDFVVDTYSTTSIKNIERQRRSKNQGRRMKISTGTVAQGSSFHLGSKLEYARRSCRMEIVIIILFVYSFSRESTCLLGHIRSH